MVPIAIVTIALAFLAVEMIIQTVEARRGKEVHGYFMPDPPMPAVVPVNYERMAASLGEFGIRPPANVFMHEGHTWTSVKGSGRTEIGISAFARKAIGKIDGLELPEVGEAVKKGERLFALKQGARLAGFVAPIDGTIVEVNAAMASGGVDSSEWILKVEPDNLSDDIKVMKVAEDAVRWVYSELSRLQQLVSSQIPRLQTVGITMQDGGVALDSLFESLDDEAWNAFTDQFLKSEQN